MLDLDLAFVEQLVDVVWTEILQSLKPGLLLRDAEPLAVVRQRAETVTFVSLEVGSERQRYWGLGKGGRCTKQGRGGECTRKKFEVATFKYIYVSCY